MSVPVGEMWREKTRPGSWECSSVVDTFLACMDSNHSAGGKNTEKKTAWKTPLVMDGQRERTDMQTCKESRERHANISPNEDVL